MIPLVIKQLLGSEKAVVALAVLAAVTVLVVVGKITIDEWMAYTQVIVAVYIGGKAVQGAAASIGKNTDKSPPEK